MFALFAAACGQQPATEAPKTGEQPQAASEQATPKVPSEPIKIAVSAWTGYAPLYVAKEKGIFEKNGVNVDIQMIGSVADRRTALAAKRIDGFASTVDTFVMTAAAPANVPLVQVLALDDSFGGDGIVSVKEINSIKDLKGKKVALHTGGGASYFWLQYLLDKEGMKLSDLNVQDMSAGDAGAAFVAGKVDAAVTWEPWLTKAKQTEFGKVLLSSDQTPGIIVDTLAFHKDFVTQYPDAVKAINKSWFEALEYAKTNPADANAIMAKAMDQTVEEFEATLPTVKFYGPAENDTYFGTKDTPGTIFGIADKAADLWLKEKLIDAKPTSANIIDGSYLK